MQELSAIEVDTTQRKKRVLDVFHAYGNYSAGDHFARDHIHGLSENFLLNHSIGSESDLIEAFMTWLKPKTYVKALYANNPAKEASLLGLPIIDFPLPKWVDRQYEPFHLEALSLKNHSHCFASMSCPKSAHSQFLYPIKHNNPETMLAKEKHGFHCSFYDVVELYCAFCYKCED